MQTRILVNGAHGRMGQEAVRAISNTPDLLVVAQTGREDDLAAAIKLSQAQLVVDFTNADVAFRSAKTIIEADAHPVMGTTGFLDGQVEQLQAMCAAKRLGGIIAPNFSLGAVLMMRFAAEAARYFPHVEIIEMHHPAKLDAPSGTALNTAEMIAKARVREPAPQQGKELLVGARGAQTKGIAIHSVRLPGVLAEQEVCFGGAGETLSIRHRALNRETFMDGLLLACRKVTQLSSLIYGLEMIL